MSAIPDLCEFEFLNGDHSVLGSSWTQESHADSFCRIYFIRSGTGHIDHHGGRFQLKPGHIYLIPSNTKLSFGCQKQVVIDWVHFNATLKNGADLFSSFRYEREMEVLNSEEMVRLFTTMIRLLKDPSVPAEFEKRACLFQILSLFLKDARPIEMVLHEGAVRFGTVLSFIEKNMSTPIRVKKLAGIMNMDPSSFSRAFSTHFKMSPRDYVRRKKMQMARKMLGETGKKLSDIAEELGFSDGFHFSKAFKNLTGKSPRSFRSSKYDILP